MSKSNNNWRLADSARILQHASALVGNSLRTLYPVALNRMSGKGSFGQLVEEVHFGYGVNSESEPDFPSAGIELKTSPAIERRRGIVAKERLVLNMINYMTLADEVNFESSSFIAKNARILLLIYLWEKDLSPLDYRIIADGLIELENLSEVDLRIIEEDWFDIQRFVREGRAHELSEGHTKYLAACRKGSGRGRDARKQPNSSLTAPSRAFSFKQSFVNRLYEPLLARRKVAVDEQSLIGNSEQLRQHGFDSIVLNRINQYGGQPIKTIAAETGTLDKLHAKDGLAWLARGMLGVTSRRITEFEKANIVMKTVRVRPNGIPAESMSFPAFKYVELAEQTWFESDLRELFSQRFLFIFFRHTTSGLIFSHAAFWAMPETDLDGEVRRVWELTVDRIRNGQAHDLPGIAQSSIAHVRPKARNAADTNITPFSRHLTKKGFWLNAHYIAQIYESTVSAQ